MVSTGLDVRLGYSRGGETAGPASWSNRSKKKRSDSSQGAFVVPGERGLTEYHNKRLLSKACLSGSSGSVSLNSNARLRLAPLREAQKSQAFNRSRLSGARRPCRRD